MYIKTGKGQKARKRACIGQGGETVVRRAHTEKRKGAVIRRKEHTGQEMEAVLRGKEQIAESGKDMLRKSVHLRGGTGAWFGRTIRIGEVHHRNGQDGGRCGERNCSELRAVGPGEETITMETADMEIAGIARAGAAEAEPGGIGQPASCSCPWCAWESL